MLLSLIAQSEVPGPLARLGGAVDWILFGVIALAFVVFGFRDVARLSWARISAISSVCVRESVRRKVLWITPLAILGAVVVSQLQVALDPQDAIRQTTKICLFASGLVVTLTAIILACTSLPKEIENRVIYTIVTKPTTRLEIVLGKVWGFAMVSGAILLIMGAFTLGYLKFREWRLRSAVVTALAEIPADAVSRPALEHYRDHGLLDAKSMSQPKWLQVLAEPPVDGELRWMAGGQGQLFGVLFDLDQADYKLVEEAMTRGGRMSLFAELPAEVREPTAAELETIRQSGVPMQGETNSSSGVGPVLPTTVPADGQPADAAKPQLPQPVIAVTIRSLSGQLMANPQKDVNDGKPIILPVARPGSPEAVAVEIPLSAEALDKMFTTGLFSVFVEGRSPAVRFAVNDRPLTLRVVERDGSVTTTFEIEPRSERPMINGTTGSYGQQIVGGDEGKGGVAVFRFVDAKLPDGGGGDHDDLTFEIRAGVERGGEGTGETEMLPHAQLRVRDTETGQVSEPFPFRPETNRISYVPVPRSAFPPGGGSFDVLVRVLTQDQWLGMNKTSVSLATGSRWFSLNLLKSLLILWLLSVLVVSIAVFCSTFLSWPIAVVLTIVLLLGRWGVEQVSDATGNGLELGAELTGEASPVTARVVREGVDALGSVLEFVAKFLPDVSSFQAMADIERGVSVPAARLLGAGVALLGYGLPVVMLAYLFLKRKEVAP